MNQNVITGRRVIQAAKDRHITGIIREAGNRRHILLKATQARAVHTTAAAVRGAVAAVIQDQAHLLHVQAVQGLQAVHRAGVQVRGVRQAKGAEDKL